MIAELHSTRRQNARTWGNRFSSRFLEAGIVSYEDSAGGAKELLRHETISKFAETFVGRPVIIRHSKVTPGTMESKAQGYISRVWFEPKDGWFYCEGVITSDEAKDLIRMGWSVSCSYKVTDTDELRGTYHNIPYARELTAFEGEHLALVENPRYENASIRLNSKQTTQMNVFKLFKKLFVAPRDNSVAATPAEAPAAAAPDAPVGEDVSADSLVDIGAGKMVPLGDLVARYNELPEKKDNDKYPRKDNESDEDYKNRCHSLEEEEKKAKDNATKENAAPAPAAAAPAAPAAPAPVKENAAPARDPEAFKTLAAASKAPIPQYERANSAETEADQLARGRQRYGSNRSNN